MGLGEKTASLLITGKFDHIIIFMCTPLHTRHCGLVSQARPTNPSANRFQYHAWGRKGGFRVQVECIKRWKSQGIKPLIK